MEIPKQKTIPPMPGEFKFESADKTPTPERLEVTEVKTYAPRLSITFDGERANEIESIELDITFKED